MQTHLMSPAQTIPPGKCQILPLVRIPRSEIKVQTPAEFERINRTAPVVRHTRVGRPKVKTGCITCKIRRIKCDEAKPHCERCTSTGRKCDGYATLPPKKTPSPKDPACRTPLGTQQLVLCKNIDWEQGASAERRAIDYFRCRTAPGVSGYFDADFWTRLVVQVAQSEPAVRHALVAVGALNERRDSFVKDLPYSRSVVRKSSMNAKEMRRIWQEQHNDPLALSQYNKAIKHLSQLMNSPSPKSVNIALLVCILFVCVECLRGDYQPAVKHFEAGMAIAKAGTAGSGPNSRASRATGIREQVLPFFNRLELLSQLFGLRPTYPYGLTPSETVPQTFSSIDEARDSIVHLINLSIRFVHESKARRIDDELTPQDVAQRADLIAHMCKWKATLDTYLATAQTSPRLVEAAAILEIHHLAMTTWLHRSLYAAECATDADIALYDRAVCLAESVDESSTPTSPSTFLFDMQLISPLYLVAIKCRHPALRRRAIAVLRRFVRREALWDSHMAAAIAERIMEIEEMELSVLDGSVLPREEVRVCNANIDSAPGLNPSGNRVTFCTRLEGAKGRVCVWTEWIEYRGREVHHSMRDPAIRLT